MDDKGHRIEQQDSLDVFWHHLERIEDRRRIEEDLKQHFPDHREVAELHIERRCEERERNNDEIDE